MHPLFALLLVVLPVSAQTFRGTLIERDSEASGELAVRAPDYHVHRFRFDARTSVVREHQVIDVSRLRPGEEVEVTAGPGEDPVLYARAINVTVPLPAPTAKRAPAPQGPPRYNALEERLRPKGDLAISGVIVRLDGLRLILRTRAGDEQTIVLRQDTRYLDNGELVAAASLKPTMRVFVRGGKNLYGDVEGYQVAWGNILEVH